MIIVRSLRFSKKYFWFSDEAIEPQSLATYLRGEKSEIGHPNAAYASQTGRGLLFFAKRVEDKSQPAGILNLVSLVALLTDTLIITNPVYPSLERSFGYHKGRPQ